MNILTFLMPLAEIFLEAEQELYADPKKVNEFEQQWSPVFFSCPNFANNKVLLTNDVL